MSIEGNNDGVLDVRIDVEQALESAYTQITQENDQHYMDNKQAARCVGFLGATTLLLATGSHFAHAEMIQALSSPLGILGGATIMGGIVGGFVNRVRHEQSQLELGRWR